MKTPIDFDEFAPVPDKGWKQQIQVDLKGGDYNQLLTWTSPEGIVVKPFYSQADLPSEAEGYPDTRQTPWNIGHAFDPAEAGALHLAGTAAENGVETLLVRVHGENTENLSGLKPLEVPQYWDIESLDYNLLDRLKTAVFPGAQCLVDPIGTLAGTGNWAVDKNTDFALLGALGAEKGMHASLSVHAGCYQNAGANRVQELAYTLSHGYEYLLAGEADPRLKPLLEEPFLLVSIGNDYFFEIAKLRALRRGWEILAGEFGYSGRCKIIASPTLRNKTLYDYNTNMLRTTSESMAAILGGADVICNLPYDALYQHPNDFGDRIARNQLLLLRHEGYFSSVANPADGSYYIESLTDQLGQKALQLFRTLEKGGGFLAQLETHSIQKKIEESAQKEQEAFDGGTLVLVGTNKYPNPDDRMRAALEKDPFRPYRKRQTRIAPILPKRLAEATERKRLENEQE